MENAFTKKMEHKSVAQNTEIQIEELDRVQDLYSPGFYFCMIPEAKIMCCMLDESVVLSKNPDPKNPHKLLRIPKRKVGAYLVVNFPSALIDVSESCVRCSFSINGSPPVQVVRGNTTALSLKMSKDEKRQTSKDKSSAQELGAVLPLLADEETFIGVEMLNSVNIKAGERIYVTVTALELDLKWKVLRSITMAQRECDTRVSLDEETDAMRSRMCKKVEWKISNISKRINGTDPSVAGVPMLSPTFTIGGIEEVQLLFYPKGYFPKFSDACGFFVCVPRGGAYLKCRAYVGDMFRDLDHEYTDKSGLTFGRGSFCNIVDAIDKKKDELRVGIIIQEAVQYKAHLDKASGSMLKVALQPDLGNIEQVRYLFGEETEDAQHRKAMRAFENTILAVGEKPAIMGGGQMVKDGTKLLIGGNTKSAQNASDVNNPNNNVGKARSASARARPESNQIGAQTTKTMMTRPQSMSPTRIIHPKQPRYIGDLAGQKFLKPLDVKHEAKIGMNYGRGPQKVSKFIPTVGGMGKSPNDKMGLVPCKFNARSDLMPMAVKGPDGQTIVGNVVMNSKPPVLPGNLQKGVKHQQDKAGLTQKLIDGTMSDENLSSTIHTLFDVSDAQSTVKYASSPHFAKKKMNQQMTALQTLQTDGSAVDTTMYKTLGEERFERATGYLSKEIDAVFNIEAADKTINRSESGALVLESTSGAQLLGNRVRSSLDAAVRSNRGHHDVDDGSGILGANHLGPDSPKSTDLSTTRNKVYDAQGNEIPPEKAVGVLGHVNTHLNKVLNFVSGELTVTEQQLAKIEERSGKEILNHYRKEEESDRDRQRREISEQREKVAKKYPAGTIVPENKKSRSPSPQQTLNPLLLNGEPVENVLGRPGSRSPSADNRSAAFKGKADLPPPGSARKYDKDWGKKPKSRTPSPPKLSGMPLEEKGKKVSRSLAAKQLMQSLSKKMRNAGKMKGPWCRGGKMKGTRAGEHIYVEKDQLYSTTGDMSTVRSGDMSSTGRANKNLKVSSSTESPPKISILSPGRSPLTFGEMKDIDGSKVKQSENWKPSMSMPTDRNTRIPGDPEEDELSRSKIVGDAEYEPQDGRHPYDGILPPPDTAMLNPMEESTDFRRRKPGMLSVSISPEMDSTSTAQKKKRPNQSSSPKNLTTGGSEMSFTGQNNPFLQAQKQLLQDLKSNPNLANPSAAYGAKPQASQLQMPNFANANLSSTVGHAPNNQVPAFGGNASIGVPNFSNVNLSNTYSGGAFPGLGTQQQSQSGGQQPVAKAASMDPRALAEQAKANAMQKRNSGANPLNATWGNANPFLTQGSGGLNLQPPTSMNHPLGASIGRGAPPPGAGSGVIPPGMPGNAPVLAPGGAPPIVAPSFGNMDLSGTNLPLPKFTNEPMIGKDVFQNTKDHVLPTLLGQKDGGDNVANENGRVIRPEGMDYQKATDVLKGRHVESENDPAGYDLNANSAYKVAGKQDQQPSGQSNLEKDFGFAGAEKGNRALMEKAIGNSRPDAPEYDPQKQQNVQGASYQEQFPMTPDTTGRKGNDYNPGEQGVVSDTTAAMQRTFQELHGESQEFGEVEAAWAEYDDDGNVYQYDAEGNVIAFMTADEYKQQYLDAYGQEAYDAYFGEDYEYYEEDDEFDPSSPMAQFKRNDDGGGFKHWGSETPNAAPGPKEGFHYEGKLSSANSTLQGAASSTGNDPNNPGATITSFGTDVNNPVAAPSVAPPGIAPPNVAPPQPGASQTPVISPRPVDNAQAPPAIDAEGARRGGKGLGEDDSDSVVDVDVAANGPDVTGPTMEGQHSAALASTKGSSNGFLVTNNTVSNKTQNLYGHRIVAKVPTAKGVIDVKAQKARLLVDSLPNPKKNIVLPQKKVVIPARIIVPRNAKFNHNALPPTIAAATEPGRSVRALRNKNEKRIVRGDVLIEGGFCRDAILVEKDEHSTFLKVHPEERKGIERSAEEKRRCSNVPAGTISSSTALDQALEHIAQADSQILTESAQQGASEGNEKSSYYSQCINIAKRTDQVLRNLLVRASPSRKWRSPLKVHQEQAKYEVPREELSDSDDKTIRKQLMDDLNRSENWRTDKDFPSRSPLARELFVRAKKGEEDPQQVLLNAVAYVQAVAEEVAEAPSRSVARKDDVFVRTSVSFKLSPDQGSTANGSRDNDVFKSARDPSHHLGDGLNTATIAHGFNTPGTTIAITGEDKHGTTMIGFNTSAITDEKNAHGDSVITAEKHGTTNTQSSGFNLTETSLKLMALTQQFSSTLRTIDSFPHGEELPTRGRQLERRTKNEVPAKRQSHAGRLLSHQRRKCKSLERPRKSSVSKNSKHGKIDRHLTNSASKFYKSRSVSPFGKKSICYNIAYDQPFDTGITLQGIRTEPFISREEQERLKFGRTPANTCATPSFEANAGDMTDADILKRHKQEHNVRNTAFSARMRLWRCPRTGQQAEVGYDQFGRIMIPYKKRVVGDGENRSTFQLYVAHSVCSAVSSGKGGAFSAMPKISEAHTICAEKSPHRAVDKFPRDSKKEDCPKGSTGDNGRNAKESELDPVLEIDLRSAFVQKKYYWYDIRDDYYYEVESDEFDLTTSEEEPPSPISEETISETEEEETSVIPVREKVNVYDSPVAARFDVLNDHSGIYADLTSRVGSKEVAPETPMRRSQIRKDLVNVYGGNVKKESVKKERDSVMARGSKIEEPCSTTDLDDPTAEMTQSQKTTYYMSKAGINPKHNLLSRKTLLGIEVCFFVIHLTVCNCFFTTNDSELN